MAFTGVAVIQQLGDSKFRITGLSLAGDASGTIGFSDKTVAAEVSLEAPTWQPYSIGQPGVAAGLITLIEGIECRITILSDVTTPVPISVVKTGTTHADFVMTLHNDTAATASADLEIFVEYGGK